MGLRDTLRKSELLVDLVHEARRIGVSLRRPWARRQLGKYIATHDIRKLHLGAGGSTHPGWIGTDIQPSSSEILCLDATQPLPIKDATFNYILCEHMIEHITWEQGLAMLRECRRILRPGGVIRIATPDLAVIIGLHAKPASKDADEYVKWITDNFIENLSIYKTTFVINNAFRNWGHKFLYDGETMEFALRDTGFIEITRCKPQESADENLRGIESHGINVGSEKMNEFETMVYEAR